MIKKFVSNALLSVVLDKKAREKLNTGEPKKPRQSAAKTAKPKAAKSKAAKEERPPIPDEDRYGAMLAGAKPPAGDLDDDPALLIRQALESAEQELLRKRTRKPMSPERQALIDNAMAIHREKSQMLDELPRDQREKLTVMAMQALKNKIDE